MARRVPVRKKNAILTNRPYLYVCPEPVLANRIFDFHTTKVRNKEMRGEASPDLCRIESVVSSGVWRVVHLQPATRSTRSGRSVSTSSI
jgi:hypothetical protein